jgi:hypothetical protein
VAKERLVGQSTFINGTQSNPLKNYDKSGGFWQIWQCALLSANRHFRCIELAFSDQLDCTTNRARRSCQLTPRTDGPFPSLIDAYDIQSSGCNEHGLRALGKQSRKDQSLFDI